MTEDQLNELYKKLIVKIVPMIPVAWEKIYFLGNVDRNKLSWTSVFYFADAETGAMVRSHDIPEKYNIHKGTYGDMLRAADEILLQIYDIAVTNAKVWSQLTLLIESSRSYKVKYNYQDMRPLGWGQAKVEAIWAYEMFNYIPEDPVMKAQLDSYIKGKQEKS